MKTYIIYRTVLLLASAITLAICTIRPVHADSTVGVTINTTGPFGSDPDGTSNFDRQLMMSGTNTTSQIVHPTSAKTLQGEVGETPVVNANVTISSTAPAKVADADDVVRGQTELLIRVTGTYSGTAGGSASSGTHAVSMWNTKYENHGFHIYYIGGTDPGAGTAEGEKELTNDYILKGYILKFVADTSGMDTLISVTWSVTGSDSGTFYSGDTWTDYASSNPTANTGATVYWRSGTSGSITDTYTVTATFVFGSGTSEGPTQTITRTLSSRSLSPTDAEVRDYFNEDVDMLQRALIQIFFLNKGNLTSYTIGEYRDSSLGFYSRAAPALPFSPVADEVKNLDQFANTSWKKPSAASSTFQMGQLTSLWRLYGDIIAAGHNATAINVTSLGATAYQTLLDNGVTASGLTLTGLPTGTTPNIVLGWLVHHESKDRHSWNVAAPLYWSSVDVGLAPFPKPPATPTHAYTDYGIGWMKMQYYNKYPGLNLFVSQDNVTSGATKFKGYYGATTSTYGWSARIWHALLGYNTNDVQNGVVPGTWRITHPDNYPDKVFKESGQTPPATNAD